MYKRSISEKMKTSHAHIWKFLCIFLITAILTSVLFRFTKVKKVPTEPQNNRDPVVCTVEDARETTFIKQVMENETLQFPSKAMIDRLSREELAAFYHRLINNIQYFCKQKVRLGKVGDSGWDVCDEVQYRPKQSCLVYSFGVSDEFGFEDAVSEKYGCEVHSFDTRMGKSDYKRHDLNYFHAYGVAGTQRFNDDGSELLTYNSILQKLQHSQKTISILKLAIESLEWEVLANILETGQLKNTDNLVVDFHLERSSLETDRNTYAKALQVLKDLYETGFRIFWTRQNTLCRFLSACKKEWRTNCHTVNFVKVKS